MIRMFKRKHGDDEVVDRLDCKCDHCAAIREFQSATTPDASTQFRQEKSRPFGKRRSRSMQN